MQASARPHCFGAHLWLRVAVLLPGAASLSGTTKPSAARSAAKSSGIGPAEYLRVLLSTVEYIRPAQVNSTRWYSTVLDGVACGVACGPALAPTCAGQRSEEMCGGVDGGVLRTAEPRVAGGVASHAAFRCVLRAALHAAR